MYLYQFRDFSIFTRVICKYIFICGFTFWGFGGCYSLDYYRMELFSNLCWDCGEVELKCEKAYASRKNFFADDFEFPVGGKNGSGYYVAQGFGEVNPRFGGKKHLGEDWNYRGGGDSDFGAPVYSIANGIVTQVKKFSGGWGLVVRVCHKLPGEFRREFGYSYIEAIYAHLYSSNVEPGDPVGKGQWIASIGDGGGRYVAHLHFEMRTDPDGELGGGYSEEIPKSFLHPMKFLSQFQKRFD